MPGKKSVHGTVTRTTRTIIVQEISDTFETESLENTVVRTTQEENADTSQPRQNPTHPTAAEDGELGTVDPKTAVHVLSSIDLDLASRVQTTIQTVTEASKESCNVTKTTRTDTTTTSGREGVELTTENELQTMRKNSKSKVTDEFQQTTHLFQNKIAPANLCKEDGLQKASQDLVPSQRTSHLFQNKVAPDIISDLESDSVTPKNRKHSVVQAKMMAVATTAVEMRRRAPKALQHQDELKTITETRLYSVFNPVLLCMKVAGIFYVARRVTQGSTVLDAMRNLSWQQIHCMATVLILLVNFLRSLTAFEGQNTFGNLLFFKLMVCIFFYESFSSSCWPTWLRDAAKTASKTCSSPWTAYVTRMG